ncbi:tubulin gamma [Nematocida minor]|uniref:tubulin gamma n=1 Tax=Nematocida minor TaxID=1912983 RepID=UPI0022202F0C|nr:tubulin gamma [Nematocida minor]KAI5192535.1 tubulin gamma [Nematocida minor]
MGNIITLQVGQCGNQIGSEFWEKVCKEHGLSNSGEVLQQRSNDRKDAFFYESYDGRYFPRGILIDLEPRVISSVTNEKPHLFSPENVWVGAESRGAGNVWSSGYQQGKENRESLLEIIQKESESSDFLDGFMLFHSVGGGTGSGLGSYLLEEIRDCMPKTSIFTVSIFPNNTEVSESVVQPYNTVLTLHRLMQQTDGVIAMDNGSLTSVVGDALKLSSPNLAYTNKLASSVAAASTATLRFPGSRFSDVSTLLSMASPIKGCHFLVPSYSPFIDPGTNTIRKTTCLDVQRRLILPKSRLVNFEESETNRVLSAVNIMMGVDAGEIEKSMQRLRQREVVKFAPWAPANIQMAISKSPCSSISGLLLSNTTGFGRTLQKITTQYDILKKRNAFLDMYKREGDEYIEEFEPARESVQWIMDEYRKAELSNYPEVCNMQAERQNPQELLQ